MLLQVRDQFMATYQGVIDSLVAWTPRVLLVFVLVIAALVVAKVVERVQRTEMTRMRFDSLIEKVGIDQAIQRIGVRDSLNQVVPRIVYYLLLILFAKTAADSMGLAAISDAIGAFMAYLPNIVAAVLILVLGSTAAQFAGRAVTQAATNSGIEFGASLGSLVSGVLMFVLGIMAVSQLKIDTEIIRVVTSAVLAGMALAFGLSFGLGSRDVTRSILAGFYARKILNVGDTVEIAGERGVLHAITPTHAILEIDGRKISVSNTAFIEGISRQS